MKRRQDVGFLTTPDEIEGRIRALDKQIQALNKEIAASTAPKVDESFREAWRLFMARWTIERDGWLSSATSRLFASNIADKYNDFVSAYQTWLKNYQSRIPGTAQEATKAKAITPSIVETFESSIKTGIQFGTLMFAAVAVGGLYYLIKQSKRR